MDIGSRASFLRMMIFNSVHKQSIMYVVLCTYVYWLFLIKSICLLVNFVNTGKGLTNDNIYSKGKTFRTTKKFVR